MFDKLLYELKLSMGVYESPPDSIYGLLAEFRDPGELVHAAREVRRAGYRHYDVHSPFPIHGMDRAMGLGNSKVGYASMAGGVTGLLFGLWLQWWTGGVDYPVIVQGKPFFAIEPSIPVIFELTILFAAFGAAFGMFAMNGLPRPYNPLFYSKNFARVTDDAFFLHVAASDEEFDRDRTSKLLQDLGAVRIEVIEDQEIAEPE